MSINGLAAEQVMKKTLANNKKENRLAATVALKKDQQIHFNTDIYKYIHIHTIVQGVVFLV